MKIGTTFFKMVFALPLLAMGGGVQRLSDG